MPKRYPRSPSPPPQRLGALVLFRAESGDADLIVTFLTRELGLISALAKNAKKSIKRFGGGLLSPGTAAYYLFHMRERSDLAFVERGEFNPKAPKLPPDAITQALCAFALELLRAFEAPRNPALLSFNLSLRFLGRLAEIVDDNFPYLLRRSLTLAFTKLYMEIAGFAPDFTSCSSCGSAPIPGTIYSLDLGHPKILCQNCRNLDGPPSHAFDGSVILKLQSIVDLKNIPEFENDELNDAFDFYFAYASRSSGKLFKSRKVLEKYLVEP
jgi:DNA repair protein RecO (recombination protein O)